MILNYYSSTYMLKIYQGKKKKDMKKGNKYIGNNVYTNASADLNEFAHKFKLFQILSHWLLTDFVVVKRYSNLLGIIAEPN